MTRPLNHPGLRRAVGLLATPALALATFAALPAAPSYAAEADPVPVKAGAAWLESQLTRGLVHNDQYDFDDYGLSADVGITLAEIGGERAALRKIRGALGRKVASWTTGVDFGSSDIYAGSTAKAVVLAQAAGANPRSFGGVNLVAQLNRRVSATRPLVGRIQDKSATDYANVIGQALAVQGLAKANSGRADEATRFLLKQQCSRGYFRLDFAPANTGLQSCDAGTRAQSAPDTDVTALAVISLQSLRHPSKRVRAAIKDGVVWLVRHQKANGSFGGGPSTENSNANSTGLAAWALGLSGSCNAAHDAAAWVSRLQLVRGLPGTPLAGERGAVAYDRRAFKDGKAHGITVELRDQWRRAAAQAAPGLKYLSVRACRA